MTTPSDAPGDALSVTETEVGTEAPPDADSTSDSASDSVMDAPEGDAADDPAKGRAAREAARYRTQLRETEAKLEAAHAALDAMRTEVARDLAKNFGLVRGEELNVPVEELLDADTGLIDADKVRGAVDALVTQKPYLKAQIGSQEWHGARPISESQADALRNGKSWADLLRG